MSRPRRKAAAPPCPICRRPRDEAFRPFCSKRCADADLARWLEGRYVIPGPGSGDDDGADSAGERDEADEQ